MLIYKVEAITPLIARYAAPVLAVGISGATGAVGVAGAVQPVSSVDHAEA